MGSCTPHNQDAPQRFRKKPVVIEAIQYRGGNDYAIQQWMASCDPPTYCHTDVSEMGQGRAVLVIPTLEGDHIANARDWIIRGVHGEFYPCKPDIFDATYEPAQSSVPGSSPNA